MTSQKRLPNSGAEQEKIATEVISMARDEISKLEFALGVGVIYEGAPPNVRYSADYQGIGKRAWEALQYELYVAICAGDTGEPQLWVKELLEGEVRNLALGIVSAIASTYDVTLGIAVPAAALVLKRGVGKYCSSGPPKRPAKGFRSMLRG